jgi:hypothetical protein
MMGIRVLRPYFIRYNNPIISSLTVSRTVTSPQHSSYTL